MPRPKGKYQYKTLEFTLHMQPDAATLARLIRDMETLTERTSTLRFRRAIYRCITSLRTRIYVEQVRTRPTEMEVELNGLIKLTQNVLKRLASDQESVSDETLHALHISLIKMDTYPDPFYDLGMSAERALPVMEHALRHVQERKKSGQTWSVLDSKIYVAQSLAWAFEHELGLMPTKSREGQFERCLFALFEAAVGGIPLSDTLLTPAYNYPEGHEKAYESMR